MVSAGVITLGLGLVAVNTATNGTTSNLAKTLQGTGDSVSAHHQLVALIIEVAFIMVLSFLADWNPDLGAIIVAVLIALWFVWAIRNGEKIKRLTELLGIGNAA